MTAGQDRGDIVVSVDARLGRQSSGLKWQARHIEKVRETSPDLTADEVRISTEDIRDEDWLKVAKSLFSSVSPHIGYGRPHTCAKPTTLWLRCPRTSVPAQRSPREVCATAAPDQRYGDPGAWFVSGARREVQPVAGISVVHPAWQCATQPLQHVRRGGVYYGLQHLYVAGCSVTFATLPSAFVGIRSDIFSAHPRLQSGSTQRGASSSPSGKLTQPPSFNLDENWLGCGIF